MSKKPISFKIFQEPTHALETLSIKDYDTDIEVPFDVLTVLEISAAVGNEKDYQKKEVLIKKAQLAKLKKVSKEYLDVDHNDHQVINGGSSKIILECKTPKVINITDNDVKNIESDDIVFSYTVPSKIFIYKENDIVEEIEVFGNDQEAFQITKNDLALMPTLKQRLSNKIGDKEKQMKIINNRISKRGHIILQLIGDEVQDILVRRYGRPIYQSPLAIFSVKGKGYDDINEASSRVYEGFLKLNASAKKRITLDAFLAIVKEALLIWEKGIQEKGQELHEKALKGLKLNCVVGYSLLNNKEKAKMYIDEVPETIKPEVMEDEEEQLSFGGRTGTTMLTYNFKGYAENIRDFFNRTANNPNKFTIRTKK
ncbi:hypothetical protein MHTCC0001_25160 [Flavobacteriaceae bacterium MHTCC 0001]